MTALVPPERLGRSRRAPWSAGAGGSTLWLLTSTTTRQAVGAIDASARAGYSFVVLAGDEPTERPDFGVLADRIARRGMRLGVCTDGARFADPEVAAGAATAWGLAWVDLHGAGSDLAVLEAALESLGDAGVAVGLTVTANEGGSAVVDALAPAERLAELRVTPDAALDPAEGAARVVAL
ncbi:MAG: hypothetical protein R3F39_16345, partial [Myxococcota bacterium]